MFTKLFIDKTLTVNNDRESGERGAKEIDLLTTGNDTGGVHCEIRGTIVTPE